VVAATKSFGKSLLRNVSLETHPTAQRSVRAQIVGFLPTINTKRRIFQGDNVKKMNSW
jgi:hypothetical protein